MYKDAKVVHSAFTYVIADFLLIATLSSSCFLFSVKMLSLTFHIQGITGHIFTDGIPRKTRNTLLVEISVHSHHHFPGTSSFLDLLVVQGPSIFDKVREGLGRAGQLDTVALVDGLLVQGDTDTGGILHTDLGADCPRHWLGLMDCLTLQDVSCM